MGKAKLTSNKDVRKLLDQLAGAGWSLERQGTQHITATSPAGDRRMSFSSSPSTQSSIRVYRVKVAQAIKATGELA